MDLTDFASLLRQQTISKVAAAVEILNEAYEEWPQQEIRLARDRVNEAADELQALHERLSRQKRV